MVVALAAALAKPEATKASDAVAGLVYKNELDGRCSNDQNEVLGWVLNGIQVSVFGYYTYDWVGDELTEVWVETVDAQIH